MSYIEFTADLTIQPAAQASSYGLAYVPAALINEIIAEYTLEGLMERADILAYYEDSPANLGMSTPPFALGQYGKDIVLEDGTKIGTFRLHDFAMNTSYTPHQYVGCNVSVWNAENTAAISGTNAQLNWGQINIYGIRSSAGLIKFRIEAANDTVYGYMTIGRTYVNGAWQYSEQMTLISSNKIKTIYGKDFDPDASGFGPDDPQADEELTDETSTPGGYGGQGAHDHTSTTIGIPSDPIVSTSSIGFFHAYHVTAGQLAGLGQYLFPTLGTIDSVEAALRTMAGLFAYRDNCQYIVDLHAIPVAPPTGSGEYIRVGALETDITAAKITSDYVNVSCGSISIPENFANFIDYIGTRCRLFLPFVGFVDIRPEYFQSGTLSVDYKFNIVDGSFMAYVRSTSSKSALSGSVIAQFGGSACIHFPVLAQSYGALVSGLVSGSMALSSGAASGNAGQAAEGAISAMQSIQLQPQLQQSNNYNASTSFLGIRTPYLIIDRAVPSFAAYYNLDEGLPCNVTVPLSKISGYTEIANIDFAGSTFATREDLEELRQLLAEGVYF